MRCRHGRTSRRSVGMRLAWLHGPGPEAAVIWLHGLGADGHDFEPIVPELTLNKPVRFVFPHAPVRPVTINNGMRMRAWYDIFQFGRGGRRAPEHRLHVERGGQHLAKDAHRGGGCREKSMKIRVVPVRDGGEYQAVDVFENLLEILTDIRRGRG